ncbi:MAG: cellulose synthase [Rhizobiaceae bacterium]|nr:cellulose synthase [Rhizobiaceae bacterium]
MRRRNISFVAILVCSVAAAWLLAGKSGGYGWDYLAQTGATSVLAQETTPSDNPPSPAPTTAPSAAPTPAAPSQPTQSQVDETALRYFARQGDTKRLQTEIARLRALYPNWTPPADPAAAPVQVDGELDRLWQLYSGGKYAEVRQGIADRQRREPQWQPPKDLLDRLSVAEARERLINASDLKQYETVIRIAAATQSLLTCGDLDVLWRVAEAFASRNEVGRARDAYQYVLRNCTNPAERLATMQKAVPLLPRQMIDELLTLEKIGEDGQGEFASIRADIVRASVSAGIADPPQPVPEADVAALETLARSNKNADDARLLGWYYLRKDEPSAAEQWFTSARAIKDDVETSQGLGLALIALERPGEAEEVLYEWRDASDELRKDYLAAAANLIAAEPRKPIDEPILRRIVPVVAAAKDADTAQQLGWYAHAFGQEQTAAQWFSTSLLWKPDEEATAYGLAVVRMALGDMKGVAEVQRNWADRSERIASVTEPSIQTAAVDEIRRAAAKGTGAAEAQKGERSGNPANTAAVRQGGGNTPRRGCSSTDQFSSATGAAALTRGWCLMELNRPMEAVEAFEAAIKSGNQSVRSEAAWGQSLANLRLGLPDRAAVSAAKAPQNHQRARQLEESILSMRATGFFDQKRYAETLLALDQRARIAPERRDLMVLRGYAYLGLRKIAEARQVFEAIAASGDPEGPRGLAAVRATITPANNE